MNVADFPEAFKAEATAGAQFLEALRQEHDLDWTFLSPSANFARGECTGTFRLGGDELLSMQTAKAGYRWKTSPSQWSTNWSIPGIAPDGTRSVIEPSS